MTIQDDGDLIKGLGFVCLYAAYLEESIDDVFELLVTQDGEFNKKKAFRWQVSRKLDYIEKILTSWGEVPDELDQFKQTLRPIGQLLEDRNLAVHGRIYANPGAADVLKPARRGMAERPAVSSELYQLANDLFDARNPMLSASMFSIPRYLRSQDSQSMGSN